MQFRPLSHIYHIESTKNPKVKEYKRLYEKSRHRKYTGLFIIEGLQESNIAYQSNYEIIEVLFCPDFISLEQVHTHVPVNSHTTFIPVNKEVINDLAMRKSIANIICLARTKSHDLQNFIHQAGNHYLVCESIEKPGNLGAMARTAHALGISAFILANPLCDIYNPNAIRSSTGSIFGLPILQGSHQEVQDWLGQHDVITYITHMHKEAILLPHIIIKNSTAWVLGTETSGISSHWLNKGFTNVIIPQNPQVDSLNVSNAAAIILYNLYTNTHK